MTGPVISDVPERERYEIALDGELAGFVTYHRRPGQIAFIHTEVEPAHEGEGIASALISAALEAARADGLAVIPICPFVQAYIKRHPDDLDLVPEDRRGRYGLA